MTCTCPHAPAGVDKVHDLGVMSDYEKECLKAMMPELLSSIEKVGACVVPGCLGVHTHASTHTPCRACACMRVRIRTRSLTGLWGRAL